MRFEHSLTHAKQHGRVKKKTSLSPVLVSARQAVQKASDHWLGAQVCSEMHVIGHFRVHVCLLFKASLCAEFL